MDLAESRLISYCENSLKILRRLVQYQLAIRILLIVMLAKKIPLCTVCKSD